MLGGIRLPDVGHGQAGEPAARPDDDECPADDVLDRHRTLTSSVLRDRAMVAHDEHLTRRDGYLGEPAARALGRIGWLTQVGVVAVGDVRLVDADPVDRDAALSVAAGDLVAGQADHPLDEVTLAGPAHP